MKRSVMPFHRRLANRTDRTDASRLAAYDAAGSQVGNYFEEENITENYIGAHIDDYIPAGDSAFSDSCFQRCEDKS